MDAGDEPLVIKGWVGDDNSFVGNVGLTLEGAAEGSVNVRVIITRSDLKQVGGETISRQRVGAPEDLTLTPDVPATLQVKVKGVTVPGEYRGKLELRLTGRRREAARPLNVVVIAGVRPTLSLLADADRIQGNLVNCKRDCALARLLFPAVNFWNEPELRFEKPPAATLPENVSKCQRM